MSEDLSVIELRLPDPNLSPASEGYPGEREMNAFWRSGDLSELPRNPSVGVALEWNLHMAGSFGYLRQLARLGTDHQAVMDEVFAPAEEGQREHLKTTHPLILLHCLYRVSVQLGRTGYSDTRDLICDFDWCETSHLWGALLPQLMDDDPKVRFITADTRKDLGSEVELGTLNVDLDTRSMSPGIARVLTSIDFSELPESPSFGDIGDLALMIDGYTLAEKLPEVRDLFAWFNPLWEAHINDGDALPGSSLHLWLMLFACQRGYLRDRGLTPEIEPHILNLYAAFRLAVQHEQEHSDFSTPLYVLPNP